MILIAEVLDAIKIELVYLQVSDDEICPFTANQVININVFTTLFHSRMFGKKYIFCSFDQFSELVFGISVIRASHETSDQHCCSICNSVHST